MKNNELEQKWIHTLEGLRFDVTRRDPLQAHKEYTSRHVADVTLDESGQVRMIVTRQADGTKNKKRKSRTGREYQVFVEQNAVTIINYRLSAGDELAAVLGEMEKEIASK